MQSRHQKVDVVKQIEWSYRGFWYNSQIDCQIAVVAFVYTGVQVMVQKTQ